MNDDKRVSEPRTDNDVRQERGGVGNGEKDFKIGSAVDSDRVGIVTRLMALLERFQSQIHNLTAFTILQAASYLIPIVTIPYFARVLGIAGMGELAIAGAVALTSGVFMDYAIQLSGTRFAAGHASDHIAINRYLDATTAVKIAIFVSLFFLLVIAGLSFPMVSDHFWVFLWSFLSAATICLFPQWLFQGLLMMPLAARILVTCRVGGAVAAILLVRSPGDVFVVPMTQALAGATALIVGTVVLKRRFGIIPRFPARAEAQHLLRENWTLFSATGWGAAYTHGGVIIMSMMLPVTSIGFYSIAQKISQAFVSMFNVMAQTAFPSFVRAHVRAIGTFCRQIRLYMTFVAVASASVLFIMFLARNQLYHFIAGQQSDLGLQVFVIWLAVSLFTIMSVSLNPVMIVMHLDKSMAGVYRGTGLTFLIAAPIACIYFGVLGIAVATLVTEGFMAVFCAVSVIREFRRTGRSLAF